MANFLSQAGIVRHGRSNSIVSKSGRRIYKNLGRMHSVDHDVSLGDKYSNSIFHIFITFYDDLSHGSVSPYLILQPEDFQTTVRLFRLNSFVKDTGRKEDAEAEPERQQWDNPMEFLMSCISMSVGEG